MSIYTQITKGPRPELPDARLLRIQTIDLHTAGEPLRVILGGWPELQGRSVLDYRDDCRQRFDHLRTALMWEPRGHADMYGCLITPPNDDGADFGVVFMHNAGYSTMCGHAVIALTRLAKELSWKTAVDGMITLEIDAPCGRVRSEIATSDPGDYPIGFDGVPSFLAQRDRELQLQDGRRVRYDLAYGGAFYAYVDADELSLELNESNYHQIISLGRQIKSRVISQEPDLSHPHDERLGFLYGTIFTSQIASDGAHSRNVCVFADGEVDRCPTGSGASGRMAIRQAKGQLAKDEVFVIESLVGSRFAASYAQTLSVGPYQAVIPHVRGNAFLTGQHEFLIDPTDPLRHGFLLR